MIQQNMLLNVSEKAANFEVLSGSEPFGERLLYGLKVAAIGILVVFLVLVILWAIVTIMGKLLGKSRKNPEIIKQQSAVPETKADLSGASEEETVVAVASAAIAAYEGKSDIDFEVVSVTPISFTEDNK